MQIARSKQEWEYWKLAILAARCATKDQREIEIVIAMNSAIMKISGSEIPFIGSGWKWNILEKLVKQDCKNKKVDRNDCSRLKHGFFQSSVAC